MDISIKKEQIEYNFLFIVVECLVKDQERCNYTLEVSGLDMQCFILYLIIILVKIIK